MEEIIDHWRASSLVADEQYKDYRLTVLRQTASNESSSLGFAKCRVSTEDEARGEFTLTAINSTKAAGYLMKSIDELYLFDSIPLSPTSDWPDLLVLTKKIIDCGFDFSDGKFNARIIRAAVSKRIPKQ